MLFGVDRIHTQLLSADPDVAAGRTVYGIHGMKTDDRAISAAAKVIRDAYGQDEDFRRAAIASILSAMKELRGSHRDEAVAEVIADRIFGDK